MRIQGNTYKGEFYAIVIHKRFFGGVLVYTWKVLTVSIFSTIVMFIGGAVTISGAFYAVYKVAKRLEDAIGTDAKGRTISERLDRVEHQLWENGGSSLADRVNKIESCSIETATEVRFIKDLIISNSIPAVEPIKKPRSSRKSA